MAVFQLTIYNRGVDREPPPQHRSQRFLDGSGEAIPVARNNAGDCQVAVPLAARLVRLRGVQDARAGDVII